MTDWQQVWKSIWGISDHFPIFMLTLSAIFGVFVFLVFPVVIGISYLERKLQASLQSRIGPFYAGPGGIFQQLIDFIKLLQKNSKPIIKWKEDLWFGLLNIALYSMISILPLSSLWVIVDTEVSVFLPFWAIVVFSLASLMMGVEQRTVQGFFGGIRIACQTISSYLPALISILCVGIHVGEFKWNAIVAKQGAMPLDWNLFSEPFQCIAFLVFICSGFILMSLHPLESTSSSIELTGGVNSKLYGVRFGLLKAKEHYGLFIWSMFTIILFCGGWNLPSTLKSVLVEKEAYIILFFSELGILLLKSFFLIFVFYWISYSNPRVRSDQITDFSWKILAPLSLVALIGSVLWVGIGFLL